MIPLNAEQAAAQLGIRDEAREELRTLKAMTERSKGAEIVGASSYSS
ncbi:hypothetical protein ABZ897_15890 [Nonomuraea sp. NPDC046802]